MTLVPTPVPTTYAVLTPVVSVPNCSDTSYTVTISWPAVNNNISIFIDDNGSYSSWWKYGVNGNSGTTSAPSGFSQRIPNGPQTLVFQPGVRHSTFIQNGSSEGPTVSWIVNACPAPVPAPAPAPVLVPAIPAPTATITINNSEAPAPVSTGSVVLVNWSSTNANFCQVHRGDGLTVGPIAWEGTTGVVTTPVTSYTRFRVYCQGNANLDAFDQASIDVIVPASIPVITGNIVVSPSLICIGQSANLAWSTSNASSISISGIGLVDSHNHVPVVPAEIGATTYTLTATNNQGSATFTTSATVNVSRCPTPVPSPLIIPTPNPVSINFNGACAYNATNSCNTTNNSTVTTTTNNTSTITQNSNGNVAGVNQAGAINPSSSAGSYNPTQSQLGLPTGSAYQSNIGLVNFATQPIVVATPTPVYYPPYIYPTPYPYYTPTPTPVPVVGLTIQKYGHNVSRGSTTNQTSISARPGDTIEFDIVVTNSTNTTLSNINVIDYLPAGLHYVSGSTALNGTTIANGVANSNGVNVGYLYAGQRDTIRLFVTVDANARNGQTYANNSATRADNYSTVNSNTVYVTVSGGVIAGALKVPTGPMDWGIAFALMGSLTAAGGYMKHKGLLSLIRLA